MPAHRRARYPPIRTNTKPMKKKYRPKRAQGNNRVHADRTGVDW